jgi:hypothetical protein
MITDTPTYDALIADRPDVVDAMVRPRWSYAAALKAADQAIAERVKKKAPAKKRTPRKAS